jgi:hypothetical protein
MFTEFRHVSSGPRRAGTPKLQTLTSSSSTPMNMGEHQTLDGFFLKEFI